MSKALDKENIVWWFQQDELDILETFSVVEPSKAGDFWTFLKGSSNNPVCIVAHADTVHTQEPDKIYHDPVAKVYWSPSGLGGDDRAGCYAAWKLWTLLGGRHSVLITTGEESGGYGALDASDALEKELGEHQFFIQLDRRGKSDAVFYSVSTPEFEKYVLKSLPRFNAESGSFTDICILCPTAGRCGVNLSIGYKNEHRDSEYLNLNHTEHTIKDLVRWLKADNIPAFPLEQTKYTRHKKYTATTGLGWYESTGGWQRSGTDQYVAGESLFEMTPPDEPAWQKDQECYVCTEDLKSTEHYICEACREENPEEFADLDVDSEGNISGTEVK